MAFTFKASFTGVCAGTLCGAGVTFSLGSTVADSTAVATISQAMKR